MTDEDTLCREAITWRASRLTPRTRVQEMAADLKFIQAVTHYLAQQDADHRAWLEKNYGENP